MSELPESAADRRRLGRQLAVDGLARSALKACRAAPDRAAERPGSPRLWPARFRIVAAAAILLAAGAFGVRWHRTLGDGGGTDPRPPHRPEPPPVPEKIVIPLPALSGQVQGQGSMHFTTTMIESPSEYLPTIIDESDLIVTGKVTAVGPEKDGRGQYTLQVTETVAGPSKDNPKELVLPYGKGAPSIQRVRIIAVTIINGIPVGGGEAPATPAPAVGSEQMVFLKRGAGGAEWQLLGPALPHEHALVRSWCRLRSAQGQERLKLLTEMLRSENGDLRGMAAEFTRRLPAARDAQLASVLYEFLEKEVASEAYGGRPPRCAAEHLGRCADDAMIEKIIASLKSPPQKDANRIFAWQRSAIAALGASGSRKAFATLDETMDNCLAEQRKLAKDDPARSRNAFVLAAVLATFRQRPSDEALPRLVDLFRYQIAELEGKYYCDDSDQGLQKALVPYGSKAIPHVGALMLKFDKVDFHAGSWSQAQASTVWAMANAQDSLAIPYVLLGLRQSDRHVAKTRGTEDHNYAAYANLGIRNALRAVLPGAFAGAESYDLLPEHLEAWSKLDAAEQTGRIRALPDRERRLHEATFRSIWADARAPMYDQAVAVRACALALLARGGQKADPEFVRELQARLGRLAERPPDLGARLTRLGSEELAEREAATKELIAMGAGAAAYVRAALASEDAEVAERARKIAAEIDFRDIEPDLRQALRMLGAPEPEAAR